MTERYDQDLILGYLEGDLGDEQIARFEQMLREDARLQNLMAQLMVDRQVLRKLPHEPSPSGLMERVNQRLERDVLLGAPGKDRMLRSPPAVHWSRGLGYGGIAAIFAISLTVVGILISQNLQVWPREPVVDSSLAARSESAKLAEVEFYDSTGPTKAGAVLLALGAESTVTVVEPFEPSVVPMPDHRFIESEAVFEAHPEEPQMPVLAGDAGRDAEHRGPAVLRGAGEWADFPIYQDKSIGKVRARGYLDAERGVRAKHGSTGIAAAKPAGWMAVAWLEVIAMDPAVAERDLYDWAKAYRISVSPHDSQLPSAIAKQSAAFMRQRFVAAELSRVAESGDRVLTVRAQSDLIPALVTYLDVAAYQSATLVGPATRVAVQRPTHVRSTTAMTVSRTVDANRKAEINVKHSTHQRSEACELGAPQSRSAVGSKSPQSRDEMAEAHEVDSLAGSRTVAGRPPIGFGRNGLPRDPTVHVTVSVIIRSRRS